MRATLGSSSSHPSQCVRPGPKVPPRRQRPSQRARPGLSVISPWIHLESPLSFPRLAILFVLLGMRRQPQSTASPDPNNGPKGSCTSILTFLFLEGFVLTEIDHCLHLCCHFGPKNVQVGKQKDFSAKFVLAYFICLRIRTI